MTLRGLSAPSSSNYNINYKDRVPLVHGLGVKLLCGSVAEWEHVETVSVQVIYDTTTA